MADKEIIKKSKCYVCGADVYFKRSKKNTAYYACNGETSAQSCGTRLFFGAMPSAAMLNHNQNLDKEIAKNDEIQSGRNAGRAAAKQQPEEALESIGTGSEPPAGHDGRSAAEQPRNSNPFEFWNIGK